MVDIISTVDDNCPVLFCNFVVDIGISLVNVVNSSVDVNFSIVDGKTVVDLIVLSEDVFGISVVISVVDISSVDDVVVSANLSIPSIGFDDDDDENDDDDDDILFVDINCSVGLSVDIISSMDDEFSVVFCKFVFNKTISSVNVVILSVDVNFAIVSGKSVVDLIVLLVDVFGISIVISVVNFSSADEVVLIVSDGVDGENVLYDISVASSVVINSVDVFGDIGVDCSVFINSTVVSGKVFVVSIVHNEETSFVVVKVTISE